MTEKATWLTEESVLQALEEILSRIKKKNLNGALDTLVYLNCEQLLRPTKDQATLQVIDRGQTFGPERVRQTCDQIGLCEAALRRLDADGALAAAQAALDRWQQP